MYTKESVQHLMNSANNYQLNRDEHIWWIVK